MGKSGHPVWFGTKRAPVRIRLPRLGIGNGNLVSNMKECSNCKISKPENEFRFRNKLKSTLMGRCKSCTQAYDKKWYQSRTEEHGTVRNKQLKAWKKNRIKEFDVRFKNAPCADCQKTYPPYVMDFDHKHSKKFGISGKKLELSWEELEEEVAKCDLVCSNCHRERTHQRLNAPASGTSRDSTKVTC